MNPQSPARRAQPPFQRCASWLPRLRPNWPPGLVTWRRTWLQGIWEFLWKKWSQWIMTMKKEIFFGSNNETPLIPVDLKLNPIETLRNHKKHSTGKASRKPSTLNFQKQMPKQKPAFFAKVCFTWDVSWVMFRCSKMLGWKWTLAFQSLWFLTWFSSGSIHLEVVFNSVIYLYGDGKGVKSKQVDQEFARLDSSGFFIAFPKASSLSKRPLTEVVLIPDVEI